MPDKRFFLSVILAVLCFSEKALSQQVPGAVSFPSPNVASLGTYEEIPVSGFTGVPNIAIPLHEIKFNDIALPISLTYHTHNVKPDLHPGWVGLGWTLQPGGAITRVVHRRPDEHNIAPDNTFNSIPPRSGYLYNYGELADFKRWGDDLPWRYSINSGLGVYNDVERGGSTSYVDLEPDEFHFNFLGYSGSFYLNHKGEWQVKSDVHLTVSFDSTFTVPPMKQAILWDAYITNAFNSFTITDDNGNRFIFGTPDAIEYSADFASQTLPFDLNAVTWHLKKIVTVNNREILFNYERGPYITNFSVDINYVQESFGSTPDMFQDIRKILNGMLISPVYLKEIVTDKEIVRFKTSRSNELGMSQDDFSRSTNSSGASINYPGSARFNYFTNLAGIKYYADNNIQPLNKDESIVGKTLPYLVWLKLDEMTIYNKDETLFKRYLFVYNSAPDKRLMLQSFGERGGDGIVKPPHRFVYNTRWENKDTSTPVTPWNYAGELRYQRDKTDYWGFYNSNNDMDERNVKPADLKNIDRYRKPSGKSDDAGAQMLSTIFYPAGGFTLITYECNKYRYRLGDDRVSLIRESTDQIAGGPRVKEMLTTDGAGVILDKKEYYYVTGFETLADVTQINTLPSSGEISGVPRYYYDALTYTNMEGEQRTMSLFRSTPAIPYTINSLGSYIGYSEVVEKSKGGYIIRRFSNYSSGSNDELAVNKYYPASISLAPFWPTTSNSQQRGRLLKELVYDGNRKLLKSKTITYRPVGIDADGSKEYVRGMLSSPGIYPQNLHYGSRLQLPSAATVKYYTYSYLPDHTEEVFYDQTNTSAMLGYTHDYKYSPQYRKVINDKSRDSKDRVISTSYTYPFDYASGSDYGANFINYPVSYMATHNILWPIQVKHEISREDGKDYVTDASAMIYKGSGSVSNKDFSVRLFQSRKLSTETPAGLFKNFAMIYKPVQEEYITDDRLNNITQYDSFDKYGNLLQYQPKPGAVTSYLWAHNKTVPVAEINNATSDDVAYSSFEDDNESGGWSGVGYVSTNRISGNAVTGKYAFNLLAAPVGKSNLKADRKYVLSFWYNTASAVPAVAGVTVQQSVEGEAVNGWKLKTYIITGGTTVTLNSISGVALIDELRLYPADALVTTYTYVPLIGITSKCGPDNRITYYNYDGLGRLIAERDQAGNITHAYSYKYGQR